MKNLIAPLLTRKNLISSPYHMCQFCTHIQRLRRTFLLFEKDEAQIMRTKKTMTTLISKLSNNEFRSLINVNRTPTLVGEDVIFQIDSDVLPLFT